MFGGAGGEGVKDMKSHKFWIISIVESSKIKIELNVFFFQFFVQNYLFLIC